MKKKSFITYGITIMALIIVTFISCKDDDCNCITDVINSKIELNNYELSYCDYGKYKGFFVLSNNDFMPDSYFVCNPEAIRDIGFNNKSVPIYVNAIGKIRKARYDIPTTGTCWEIEILNITK